MAIDCVRLPKGSHNGRGESEDGNTTDYIVCYQLDLFISVGHYHGLGNDAKSTYSGAGIVCWRWR